MADTNPAPTKPKVTVITDNPQTPADQLKIGQDRLTEIKSQLKALEGKPGVNPFLWAKQNHLAKLEARLKSGDASVVTDILKLPAVPTCVVSNTGPVVVQASAQAVQTR